MKKKKSTRSRGRFLDVLITVICVAGIGVSLFYFYKDFSISLSNDKEEPAGAIYFKKNSAQRRLENRNLWERLKVASPVYNGDRIRTGALSEAYAIMNDGSRIEIHENTLIQIFTGETNSVHFSTGSISVSSSTSDSLEIMSGDKIITLAENSVATVSIPQTEEEIYPTKNSLQNSGEREKPVIKNAAIEVSSGNAKVQDVVPQENESAISKIIPGSSKRKAEENRKNTAEAEKNVHSVSAGQVLNFTASVKKEPEIKNEVVNPVKSVIEAVKRIPQRVSESEKTVEVEAATNNLSEDSILQPEDGLEVLLPPTYYSMTLQETDNYVTFCWKNAPSMYVEFSNEPAFENSLSYKALQSASGIEKYELPPELQAGNLYWRASSSTSSNFISGIIEVRKENVKISKQIAEALVESAGENIDLREIIRQAEASDFNKNIATENLSEEERIAQEKIKHENERLQAKEESLLAEEKLRAEEEARLAEEMRIAEEDSRAAEEIRKAEESARLAEEKRKAEEAVRLAEEKRKTEEAARLAEEKRKAEDAARLAEERRKAEEAARLAEEKRKAEEAARLAEERRKAEEAARLAEEKRNAEEVARLAEEKRKAEEAARLAEERRKAEEAARLAEERRKAEEEARLAEERRKAESEARLAEERRKAEEEARLAEERRKAEEEARLAEERRKAEEEARLAEERRKAEEEARLAEERRKAEEAARLVEKRRKTEEAARIAEEKRKTEESVSLSGEKRNAQNALSSVNEAAKASSTNSSVADKENSAGSGSNSLSKTALAKFTAATPALNLPEAQRNFKDSDFSSKNSPAIQFAWSKVDSAAYYELEIKNSTGKTVFKKNVKETSYLLEKNISVVAESGAYTWFVTAKTKNGSEVVSSKSSSRSFTITLEDVKAPSVDKSNLIVE